MTFRSQMRKEQGSKADEAVVEHRRRQGASLTLRSLVDTSAMTRIRPLRLLQVVDRNLFL